MRRDTNLKQFSAVGSSWVEPSGAAGVFIATLFVLLGLFARPPVSCSAQTEAPTAARTYMGRQIAATMHYAGAPWLVRESRQREEDCRRLLAELKVRPGQSVCDMGCGNGFYTLQLAALVGEQGKVYAVDIQKEMLEMLRIRAREAGLANIVPRRGTTTDPRLPAASLDLVLMVDVYHEFSHPEEMLGAIRRSLKPGGRIALAEFRAEDPEVPIKPLHKMSKAQILKEFRANGFKLVDEFDELPWQHLMFFECQATPVSFRTLRRSGFQATSRRQFPSERSIGRVK